MRGNIRSVAMIDYICLLMMWRIMSSVVEGNSGSHHLCVLGVILAKSQI